MTIKFNRAAGNQYVTTPDNDALTFPNGDYALAFILKLDGETTGTGVQYLFSTGPVATAGTMNLAIGAPDTAITELRNKIGWYRGTPSAPQIVTVSNFAGGDARLVVLQRSGSNVTLRTCPILNANPVDGSAVVQEGSITSSVGYDGTALLIGSRYDINAANLCDHSLGRFFRFDGVLTDLEVAKLAYGMEITDLGKTPTWYVRLDTVQDTAGRGSAALPWTVSGTPTNTSPQIAFGYNPGAAPAAPAINGVPTLKAAPQVGVSVGYNPASTSGSPTPSITQQWTLDGVDIADAKGTTYTPVDSDAGKTLRVRQIATNSQGTANATSAGGLVKVAIGSFTSLPLTVSGTLRTPGTTCAYTWHAGGVVGEEIGTPYYGSVPLDTQSRVVAPNLPPGAGYMTGKFAVDGGVFYQEGTVIAA